MKNGSQHDPRSAPTSEPFAEVVDQPGWFGRTWSRVGRAWRWVRRKHEPISEGIETAGRGWTRAARTAARNGQSLTKIGAVIERNGAILAKGRGRPPLRPESRGIRGRTEQIRDLAHEDREKLGAPRREHRGHRRAGYQSAAAGGAAGPATRARTGPNTSFVGPCEGRTAKARPARRRQALRREHGQGR